MTLPFLDGFHRHREGVVLDLYSNGFSAILGETVVRQAFGLSSDVALDSGEPVLRDRFGKNLPLSIFVRMRR